MNSARSKWLSAACVAALVACAPSDPRQSAPGPKPLDFDMLFADDAIGRTATSLAWSPSGDRLGFFFEDENGKSLWIANPADGSSELLLRGEEGDLGKLDAFEWAPGGDALLAVSKGDLWLFDLAARALDKLTSSEAAEENPEFSPDGASVAFVRDNDLWLLDLAERGERRLTRDGAEGVTLNGKTDWVYWEEIWGRQAKGLWWSPDAKRIAYYRFDETPVREYPLVDFTQQYPEVTWQKYPKAGERNPIVQVGVLDLETGDTRWLLGTESDDSYLARVDWLPDGRSLAIQRLNRDQDHLELLACDVVSGGCRPLAEQTAKTWVNLTEDLRFLPDGRFVWTSEETGWRKLWLHAADGKRLRDLTPAGWTVDHVDELSNDGGLVFWTGFESSALGALHRAAFVQSLAEGGEAVALSDKGVTASAVASAASGLVALRQSRADLPTTVSIVDGEGARRLDLPASAPSGYDPAALPSWRFLTIPGPDGTALPAALLEPADRLAGRRYPVIHYHYGCPASQVVRDAWGRRRNLWHRLMAGRGYGVLLVDNGGSNFFGKKGADSAYRRFGSGNAAAQKAAVSFLRTLDWADTSRIGLWGWSGGGSNTLYAILDSPQIWRAAVAGAPVTDWRLYDSIWTERYLDHPEENPDGYTASSPITYAANLDTALLLVHGTADDNVHPQNTFAMAAELIAAGRHFELAVHPRQKHGFRSQDSRHFFERMTAFFDRELADPDQNSSPR